MRVDTISVPSPSRYGRTPVVRTGPRKQRPVRLLLGLSALVALTVACTSPAQDAAPGRPTESTTQKSTELRAAGEEVVRAEAAKVPAFQSERNARRDVTIGSCSAVPGEGWRMTGAIKNTATGRRSFTLVTDFVTNPGNTVRATKVIRTRPVDPGKSIDWNSTGGAADQPLICLLRYAQAT